MTDIQAYIESGIIEEYCLGLLPADETIQLHQLAKEFPIINQEIERTEATLAKYASTQATRQTAKGKFLDTITQLTAEENLNLHHLPRITPYSDAQKWKDAVAGIVPEIPMEGCLGHVLTMTPQTEQYLIWLHSELVEDAHNDLHESFLILEGTCECNLGGQLVRFGAGDYFEIPLMTHHTIRNTSADGPIKAIVQRILE
ncbi:MAG: cupin domain-containing protein [Spirosomataceae bacterium]